MESSICNSELTAEEERLAIRDVAMSAQSQCKQGDAFYLITQRWWQQWLDFVNQQSSDGGSSDNGNGIGISTVLSDVTTTRISSRRRPSSIDNSDLIYDDDSTIHPTLVEGRDYVLLPQDVWNQLYLWYGGGPTLIRRVINSGLSQTELAVEVYLLRLELLVMPKGQHATVRISKKETVRALHKRACEIFHFNLDQVCIWDYYGHRKHSLMNHMDKTLDDANLQMDQDILVEVFETAASGCLSSVQENGFADKESTSMLVEPCKSSLSTAGGLSTTRGVSRSCSSELSQSQYLASPVGEGENSYVMSGVSTRGSTGGLTGLLNLGNTCFMNSAIQCLVHTPEFARYFREDYHPEINWQNPLGMVGELAVAFGDLLRKLWSPGRAPISPRPFKIKLARFAPQFSGYNQHDSQELLAFLLDGLHEDLNRVKHKPYIKSKDADGRPDEEVADEYWANYLARNDSIIVDVCQGQYKSTLVCPVCGKVSVTFDPFMWLSLPLQPTNTRSMTVTVVSSDGATSCTVSVPKHGRCRDLIQALSSACSLKSDSEKLLLAEIRGHVVSRLLEDLSTPLSTIKDDDHLAAYKMPKLPILNKNKLNKNKTLVFQLVHRRQEKESTSSSGVVRKPYGTPIVSSIIYDDDTITHSDIQGIVGTMLSPFRLELKATEEDLPLELVVDNACTALEGEIKVPSSSMLLVYIDWSDKKVLGKYDTSSLENMPAEVVKYGPPTSKKARSEPLSLYTCLEAFLREEPLVPEDMWNCPQCKEQRQASKKLDLWRLPEVLVIHLKRFSYNRSMKHKLETYVNFPIHDFDLTNYVAAGNNKRQMYELYALSNHYGGMGSGHYTAHIKLVDDNRWYNFDDNHVSPINEEDVKSAAAYVLFYRKVKTSDDNDISSRTKQ
ncbi:ubiquitinyl hydrolase 1 [Ranunculus cassubicifolius]